MLLGPSPNQGRRATAAEILGLTIVYLELLSARWDALDQGLPMYTRSVPLAQLGEHGVEDSILLWMLYQAHIVQVDPAPQAAGGFVSWCIRQSAIITETSSFALTEVGEEFADWLLGRLTTPPEESDAKLVGDYLWVDQLLPHYDRERRLFSWGRHLLKHYRQPSFNQEIILRAAEELGWPTWFDDPLPRRRARSSKVRLHDTIKDLNRHQNPHLIHFKGDGTGTRIGWELR